VKGKFLKLAKVGRRYLVVVAVIVACPDDLDDRKDERK
jgi:hypothetical protein